MRIPPQTGVAFSLKAGQKLKVTDPEGQQVADLFCFAEAQPGNALSSGRSIDYAEKIYFTRGDLLFSQSGEPMLKIIEDDCGRHDFLVTPCSQQMFEMISGRMDPHPSCLENLEKSLKDFPIDKSQIGTTFNIFMNVPIDNSGKIRVDPPLSKPGHSIVFEAQMDLIVGLTACSDEGTNNGACKPIDYEIR